MASLTSLTVGSDSCRLDMSLPWSKGLLGLRRSPGSKLALCAPCQGAIPSEMEVSMPSDAADAGMQCATWPAPRSGFREL